MDTIKNIIDIILKWLTIIIFSFFFACTILQIEVGKGVIELIF